VSVVVPCYNYGKFLPQCVDSVLAQPGVDVDVLIVDDASPDGSGEVAQAIAQRDPRVSVIRHERNCGHIATYNEGLERATGDYAVMLSADDIIPIGAFARAVALMEANPSVGFAYGHPVNFSGPEPPAERSRVFGWSVWSGGSWIRAQSRRGLNCIYCTEVVMRNSTLKSVGGFRGNLPHTADLELWLRFATVADVGHVNGADQAFRRIHGDSMMQTGYSDALIDLVERKKTYDIFFTSDGAKVNGSRAAHNVVLRRLAAEAIEHACRILASGGEYSPSAEDYVEFAHETCPEVAGLRAWREYRLLTSPSEGRLSAVWRRGYAAERDLSGRIRYRRWQVAGV
jgi:glycosyltransferase involved in cell wall biosynthesis